MRAMVVSDQSVSRLERRAAIMSVAIGFVLMCGKFAAYFATHSSAIYSDALESIVNVLASCFALYALHLAHRPADENHPYGHGKVEFLSAGFEGGLIFVAALVIAIRALDTILSREIAIERLGLGLAMTAAAMAGNGAMGLFLLGLGRRHGSITLEADGKHLLSDALTSVIALLALGVVRVTGWTYADPAAALVIAGYIARLGWGLLRRSYGGLMDEQDTADQRLIESILDSHVGREGREPHVCSYHKLRHRHAGRYHWIDFHLVLPADLSIQEGHVIASGLEYEIEKALGQADATAHVEPCGQAGCSLCRPVESTS